MCFLLCVVGIFVMRYRCLGYLLYVFIFRVIRVYIICCKCLGYLVLEFMLCAVCVYNYTSIYKIPTKNRCFVKCMRVAGVFLNELGWNLKASLKETVSQETYRC